MKRPRRRVLRAGDGPYALLDRNSGFPAFVRSNAGNFGNFADAGVYTEGTRTCLGSLADTAAALSNGASLKSSRAEDDSACQWLLRRSPSLSTYLPPPPFSFSRPIMALVSIGQIAIAMRSMESMFRRGEMRSNFLHEVSEPSLRKHAGGTPSWIMPRRLRNFATFS